MTPARRHPFGGNGFDQPRVAARRQPQSAVFLGDVRAEQAHLAHLLDEGFRIFVGLLQADRHRAHLGAQEALDRVDHRLVLALLDGLVHRASYMRKTP